MLVTTYEGEHNHGEHEMEISGKSESPGGGLSLIHI